jgi:IclR family mhp operon transcriptional activator
MVPAGDHMEIRETTRTRSPILLQQERIGLPVNWLNSAVGRAYLAFCSTKERQRIIDLLRSSSKTEDRLAREPSRLNAILAETRARGYGIRDAAHVGGYYGGPPHADGLLSIAVPLGDGNRIIGAINMLWLRRAHTVEAFAAQHLPELQAAAAEIVGRLRQRKASKIPSGRGCCCRLVVICTALLFQPAHRCCTTGLLRESFIS